jgi:hypothetical protein
MRGLEFLFFDGGIGALLHSQVGSTGSLYTVGGTSRIAGCHSLEELGFQLLDRREVALLQEGTV